MSKFPVRKRHQNEERSSEVGVRETTTHTVDLFDRTNPKSIINLLSESAQAKVYVHSRDRADLFKMNEKELKRATKPTATECRLRLAFWNEFNEAMATNQPMILANVYTGICTRQYFEGKILNEATCVAWMMCPPANYIVAAEEMLLQSQERLREILEEDPVVDGVVNVKLAELQLKIHLAIENRLRGSTVQRTQLLAHIKNESTNTNRNETVVTDGGISPEQAEAAVTKALSGMSLAEIEAKLKKVKRAQAQGQNLSWTKPAATTEGLGSGE